MDDLLKFANDLLGVQEETPKEVISEGQLEETFETALNHLNKDGTINHEAIKASKVEDEGGWHLP